MRLNTRPVLAGFVIGAIAAIAIVLLPSTAIESLGSRTHLADMWDVARPPLGTKARILIALVPFLVASAVGIVLGFVLAKQKPEDDEYGSYHEYDLGPAPSADPFAPSEPYAAVSAPASISEDAPIADQAPLEAAPPAVAPPAPMPAPAPAIAAIPPIDVATAADVAELAEAIVKLTARMDAAEARLAAPAPSGGGARLSPELADRLARIVKALDDAG